jgi:hypothetical protein
MMLLQPHSRISHSVGRSVASNTLNFRRDLLDGPDMFGRLVIPWSPA